MSEINWFLPFLIFIARIIDVTLGTLRIIYLGKGKRLLAPLLGFVEVFVWVYVISQLVQHISNIVGYLAYAAGFAVGNYVGIVIENRLALGTLVIRAIIARQPAQLVRVLKEAGYGVTCFDAQGAEGPVKVIYTVIKRRELEEVIQLMRQTHPHVFYTVEEARVANEGIFHKSQHSSHLRHMGLKGKR